MRARILILAGLAAVLFAGPLSAHSPKLDTSLDFLKHLRDNPERRPQVRRILRAAYDEESITVTVKFDHVLSDAEIAAYVSLGVFFFDFGGETARTGCIYPARIPWSALEEIEGRHEVVRLESAWRPAVYPILDVSGPEVEADTAGSHSDPLGYPLTGSGMRIADFDTGIDVFHPSFFLADGDTFEWMDPGGFGMLIPGYCTVDLNRNGEIDAGELLDFMDAAIYDPANVWGTSHVNSYQVHWDWLYNDANENGVRDYGGGAGFTEDDPTFGELVFIALDENGNGIVNPGEKLVALNSSKIYATMNAGAVERMLGADIILSDPDVNGHGTAVSGILAGGTLGRHKFTGIAPDAEILMGYFFSDLPLSLLIPWARSRGADVMLYEFAAFVWSYLDGSSLDEEAITIESSTIFQVTPSGNLARGAKHAVATVPPADSIVLRIDVPTYIGQHTEELWGTTLWRSSECDLTFRLKSPAGGWVELRDTETNLDGYYVYSEKSRSPRGTCALHFYVWSGSNSNNTGIWTLSVTSGYPAEMEILSNVADELSAWAGGASFLDYVSNDRNVTWPATADGGYVNGSYSTRGFEGYGGVGSGSIPPGEISAFSGRGRRIDGRHLLDICSPGNYDVYSTRTHQDAGGYPLGSYRQFSGTSAAGPHVAGAAAIVLQAVPEAAPADAAYLLSTHAAKDEFTGDVYNDTWGWGKLRILRALGIITDVEDMAVGSKPPRLLLDQNYPNPFNPTTWIPFFLPSGGNVGIAVYDARGGLVKVLGEGWMGAGAHSVRWMGDTHTGRAAASGVYFCILRFGGEEQTRKLILVR